MVCGNKKRKYFFEVIVKRNKDRQRVYILEIELKEKLTDVFSTAHHCTSVNSMSIIADLLNNLNPKVYYLSVYQKYKNKKSSLSDYANTHSLEKPNEDTSSVKHNSKDFNLKLYIFAI